MWNWSQTPYNEVSDNSSSPVPVRTYEDGQIFRNGFHEQKKFIGEDAVSVGL